MEKKYAWYREEKEPSKVHSSHMIHGYAFTESLCKLMDECFDGEPPVPIDVKVG